MLLTRNIEYVIATVIVMALLAGAAPAWLALVPKTLARISGAL